MEESPAKIPEYRSLQGSGAIPPGITPAQLVEFQLAEQRAKKIRRAVTVARTDAWISAILATMATLSFCLDWSALIIGPALGVIAWNSFRGAARLRKFDLAAPKILAMNQLFLAVVIIIYCVYSLYTGLSGHSVLDKQLAALGEGGVGGVDVKGLVRLICWLLYGGLIVGTIIAQGLTGLYYGSRKKLLEIYLKETPEWIVSLQKMQAH